MTTSPSAAQVLALCGGIGGAKLALGLYRVLKPEQLAVIVNTGDDFEHLGLSISPDLDTLLYTLGGLADPERGWGRAHETWEFMRALGQLGGETLAHRRAIERAREVGHCALRCGANSAEGAGGTRSDVVIRVGERAAKGRHRGPSKRSKLAQRHRRCVPRRVIGAAEVLDQRHHCRGRVGRLLEGGRGLPPAQRREENERRYPARAARASTAHYRKSMARR